MNHVKTRGYRAFWVHRASGLLILGYLYLHLTLLSAILLPAGPHDFNAVAHVVEQPPFIAADLILFVIIVVHAVNGLRLMLVDLGLLIERHRLALWAGMVVSALLVFGAVWALMPFLVG
jgi:succinate dehydrogenase / fumarate reductase cytochrome b subunit